MTPEIRNIKGEIIQDADDEEQWYLSRTTWFLIGGAILLIGGCGINQNVIDGVFRLLDFRLWPWWYFAILLLVCAFSVKWYLLFQAWEDFDTEDIEVGRQFLRMSFTITAELLVLVLLKATKLMNLFYNPLERWFGFGDYSHMAALSFLLVCAAVVTTIYVIKEWYVTAFPS